jgi:hypothetical protein
MKQPVDITKDQNQKPLKIRNLKFKIIKKPSTKFHKT